MKNFLYFIVSFLTVSFLLIVTSLPGHSYECFVTNNNSLGGDSYYGAGASSLYTGWDSVNGRAIQDPAYKTPWHRITIPYTVAVWGWNGNSWITTQTWNTTYHISGTPGGLAAISSALSGMTYTANPTIDYPTGCPPPPEDCSEYEGQREQSIVPGKYPPGPYCVDGCEAMKVSDGSGIELYNRGENKTLVTYEYTGQPCDSGTEPDENQPDCDDYRDMCTTLCRGGTMNFTCDPDNPGAYDCGCELPPWPVTEDPPGSGEYHPDQDRDGDGSGASDDDNDGDGDPNSSDPDVDGDGKPNGDDNDTDGDGTGNGGDTSSWNPKRGSPGGYGADPDVNDDGASNGYDSDVDGDGVLNGQDGDIDGDGIPNQWDGDMDGDGIPNGSDPDVDGDGVPNGDDTESDGPVGEEPEDPEYEPPPPEEGGYTGYTPKYDDVTYNWGPINEALAKAQNKFPFTVAQNISNVLSELNANPVAPSFTVNFPIVNTSFQVDLSIFNPIVLVIRWLFSVVLVVGTLFFIIRMWIK